MRKVTDFIVNRSKLVLLIFLFLSIFCFYLMQKVTINSDMSKYLPASSETKIGYDIMNKEFEPLKSSTLYVMFENLDDKDAILQMLDRDISEAEDHYNIALTNHFIHIRQLINLQDSRVKGLFREFEKDVNELENEFNTEFEEIKKQFEQEQNEILKMLHNITETYNKKIAKLIKMC